VEDNLEERYLLWIDEIKNDEIILSNGEYRLKFSVLSHHSTGQGLPDLFQEATITDKFEVQINSLGKNSEEPEQSADEGKE